VLTGSDDMTIKACYSGALNSCQVYEGHAHYITNIIFNPNDSNTFASNCLRHYLSRRGSLPPLQLTLPSP
ncbi:hypothetical protein BD769DRAFT_1357329, partial [Suillus cothurnatus]